MSIDDSHRGVGKLAMSVRVGRLLCLTLVLLVSASTVGSARVESTNRPLDRVRLQLKWKHQFQFAGYYAAIEQGFYRAVGLEVTLLEPPPSIEPGQQVVRGNAEFGVASSDLVVMRAHGSRVVALAPIYQHSPLVFLVSANSGISHIHELSGKRVAIESHAAELLAYLQYERLPLTSLDLSSHSYDVSELIDGKVDALSAYSTDEPFLLEEAGLDYLLFNPRAGGIDFYGDTLFTTQEQIEKHPERVRNFLNASLQGWEYALEHSDEIVDLILTRYSQRHTREHLAFEAEKTRRLILPDVVEIGYNNLGRWRHIADTYRELGMIPADASLDGFLYRREIGPDLSWFYWTLASVLAAFGIVLTVSVRFYQLNVRIQKQACALQAVLDENKVLQGIIPICSHCKRIRDDKGYWYQLERFFSEHSDAVFSHGICDDCLDKHYDQRNGPRFERNTDPEPPEEEL